MIDRPNSKTKRYTADMYKYDDGIDPRDLLEDKGKQAGKPKLFHNWLDNFTKR